MTEWAVRGTAFHAPSPDRLEVLTDALIVIGADGVIARVETDGQSTESFRAAGRLTELGPQQYLIPGLVDCHIHAPQWPQLGKALDIPLERWLQDYTFKLEARYADTDYARAIYSDLVATLLANGTTTAVYFATLHLPATQILAEICLAQGQRALIGRVAMDDPVQCPETYRDPSAAVAIEETRHFIEFVKALPGNDHRLIEPVITPRFIPACSDALLQGLGDLASETGCAIQTHCSESDWEHGYVLDRCGKTDTVALAEFGLMTRRTVLAHGNHVTAADRDLIRDKGAAIAHCPLSNAYFADAVLPVRACLDHGVHVALGTDIAGGASPSLFDSARMAVTMSRMLETGVDPARSRDARGTPGARIDFVAAFYLATAAGGIALDLPIGLFRLGYRFDALVIDSAAAGSNLRLYAEDSPSDIMQKIICNASQANVAKVWVDGKLVRG
jgi:guanine deaminase